MRNANGYSIRYNGELIIWDRHLDSNDEPVYRHKLSIMLLCGISRGKLILFGDVNQIFANYHTNSTRQNDLHRFLSAPAPGGRTDPCVQDSGGESGSLAADLLGWAHPL
jgi:hypothetical protein